MDVREEPVSKVMRHQQFDEQHDGCGVEEGAWESSP